MKSLEQQLATITEPNDLKYHAEFERYFDTGIENVKVFMVRDNNNSERIYLGDLEANGHGYEGDLIFNLKIVEMIDYSIHVPLNVFVEIAAYRLTPQETAKATA
jgi:hypothetical protein